MDAYSKIEKLIADKYGKGTTTRKAVGDFMLADESCRKRQEQQRRQTELLTQHDLDQEDAQMGLRGT